jgi:hypothetical protein
MKINHPLKFTNDLYLFSDVNINNINNINNDVQFEKEWSDSYSDSFTSKNKTISFSTRFSVTISGFKHYFKNCRFINIKTTSSKYTFVYQRHHNDLWYKFF